MSSEARASSARKLPLGGILVLAIVGGAVLLFTAGDMSWNPLAGPATSAQPMELSGLWLGMRLAGSNTPSAQSFGVPPTTEGVIVAGLTLPAASRAQQAGLLAGDVLVGIDGNTVANLTDLYALSTTLDVNRPLPISIIRRGQPFAVLLPPPPGALVAGLPTGVPPMGMSPAPPQQAFGMSPGLQAPAAVQPLQAPMPAQGPAPAAGAMYFCPNDRLYWSEAQVSPNFSCPRCGGHLAR